MLRRSGHNPDVLSCLANLSSDEVFTPPKLANEMLDMLPARLWTDKRATFLDPACKSGVFLREIARRLDKGLESQVPDRQARINHIMTSQVFGIAITNLTALVTRRSLYCSKKANGKYSICTAFSDAAGGIKYRRIEHTWGHDGRCSLCGASKEEYDRGGEMESHAYEYIHTDDPKGALDMEFDVVVGNPPYQLSDAGDSTGSSPIYQLFVEQAKKLNPRYLAMIIPSRWFAGGKGLVDFRDSMLRDSRIRRLVDYPIASDVFPGVKVIGGVCYFLWDRDHRGLCSVTTRMNNEEDTMQRRLDQFDVFVRFNRAISTLDKVRGRQYPALADQVSRQKPFGLRTFERPTGRGRVKLYANKEVGLIPDSAITAGRELLGLWKVLISRGYGEGGEARDYPRMIIGKPIVAPPGSACTETYLVAGAFRSSSEAENLAAYLRTRFVRFLVGLRKNTQDVTRERFAFVPALPVTRRWTDKLLYQHFGLTDAEVAFIESMVRPMDDNGE